MSFIEAFYVTRRVTPEWDERPWNVILCLPTKLKAVRVPLSTKISRLGSSKTIRRESTLLSMLGELFFSFGLFHATQSSVMRSTL
jgi:hypothetical protein